MFFERASFCFFSLRELSWFEFRIRSEWVKFGYIRYDLYIGQGAAEY